MTEAWRPFTDDEMRRIIEGEKVKSNNKDDIFGNSLKKSNNRVMRGRNYKRDNSSRMGAIKKSDVNGDKQSAQQRIPQIPEEDEIEEDVSNGPVTNIPPSPEEQNNVILFREPLLKSETLVAVSRKAATNGDDVENQRLRPVLEEEALQRFQERQKAMEESNQLTKQVLQKALSDRAKKTREEAEKLNKIEEELKKLDQMLSTDVTIIRHQIEVASHEYMEAHAFSLGSEEVEYDDYFGPDDYDYHYYSGSYEDHYYETSTSGPIHTTKNTPKTTTVKEPPSTETPKTTTVKEPPSTETPKTTTVKEPPSTEMPKTTTKKHPYPYDMPYL